MTTHGLAKFNTLYPASTAGPLGSLLQVCIAYGGTWLIFYTCFSPAPFRWLFPQLGVATALLLTRTPSICSNPNFRSGYALLARALAAPDTAAGALCRACQPAAVLATFAAVACHLYGTELAQRRAFLARLRAQRARPGAPGVWCPPDGSHTVRGGERARDGPIPAHDGRACMSEFWLSFAVPAIGALLSFVVFPVHLRE
ncbi:cation acetate symporter [Micractinium conductrix]|uniref:Cation acetate symporter n=1 Tax=Micractinium conductrix TaxID=554055 RepID=A0A2P6V671_9CHLO|nr:cation acetate symporter [Micractinium conductrix]|eukprot:PSC69584.1 cation acetate symporter [Micractinium conductrix]